MATQKDLRMAIKKYIPKSKKADTRLGRPGIEISYRGENILIPLKESSVVNNHISGGSG